MYEETVYFFRLARRLLKHSLLGMFIHKFVINNTVIQLGIPYLITTIAVYLVKIAIVLLLVEVVFVIIKKCQESKK